MLINKCEFISVAPEKYNASKITLSSEGKKISICIGNSSNKIEQGLINILNNEVDRCYFSFGMTDIDVFKMGDMFIIEVSPIDGVYNHYGLDVENFKKLIQNI